MKILNKNLIYRIKYGNVFRLFKAVENSSTYLRIGSSIFGQEILKNFNF